MKDFRTLQVLDRFQGLFERLGADYKTMRLILQTKLTMDRRRVPTIFNQSNRKKQVDARGVEKDENNFNKSLGMYGLLGLLMVPFMLIGDSPMFQMSIVFSILMFMIMTSMISDFSSVLLDIRDKHIIGTKPVTQKTVSMAKAVHVGIYLFFLTLSLTAAPLVTALIKHGIVFFLLFAVEIVLVDMFIVVVTALVYMLILRFFDGEKLKDIINYVQIVLSIAITVGYQLAARSFDLVHMQTVFKPAWWQAFVPSVWFAAPFEWLLAGNGEHHFVIFTGLAVFVPIVSFALYMNLVPSFERNLMKLSHSGAAKKKERRGLAEGIAKLLCKNPEERSFYRFASLMMRGEREFKLKVYPSLGFSFIFPFIFMFNALRDGSWAELAGSKWYLAMYMTMIIIPTVIMMLKYSGKHKGAWIYRTTPVREVGAVFSGSLKAFLVRLYVPVYILVSIAFLAIFGVRVAIDLAAVLLASALFTVVCFKLMKKVMPFSEPFSAAGKGDGVVVLPLMLLIGAFVFLHFASTLLPFGSVIYAVLMLVANIAVWRLAFRSVKLSGQAG